MRRLPQGFVYGAAAIAAAVPVAGLLAISLASVEARPLALATLAATGLAVAVGAPLIARRSEARLRRFLSSSERRFQELFDEAPVGYHILDVEGKIVQVNRTELEMLGYTREEMIGHGAWEFVDPPEVAMGAITGKLTGTLSPTSNLERTFRRKDGSLIPVSISDALIRDSSGKITGIRTTLEDITERVRTRTQLQEHATALERSNAELQQFAYVASHDLQEPLRMITSYVQLLERRYADRLDDDAREFIAFASDGAARMRRLIQDLLSYSRVTTSGAAPEPVESSSCLDDAQANLRLALDESGTELVVQRPLPRVYADPTQLTQLFQNLISNAIKFNRKDRPRVEVTATLEAGVLTGERLARFTVADNGIGIEERHHERIFQIFQRLHKADDFPGTGIGLALCKKIVERLGGTIEVTENSGGGTVFHFSLPAASAAPAANADPPP
ncbi:hypothetical protein BH23VER1_BH23VER1_01720 [soil metagenome]